MAHQDELDEFSDLPEAFQTVDAQGFVVQIKEPCWQCMSQGFYGGLKDSTLYEEGEILRGAMTPNHELRPLNKAAGDIMRKWLDSLPQTDVPITIEDMSEAAAELVKHPKLGELSADQISALTQQAAVRARKKRMRALGIDVPSIRLPNAIERAAGQSAPAMPNVSIATASTPTSMQTVALPRGQMTPPRTQRGGPPPSMPNTGR